MEPRRSAETHDVVCGSVNPFRAPSGHVPNVQLAQIQLNDDLADRVPIVELRAGIASHGEESGGRCRKLGRGAVAQSMGGFHYSVRRQQYGGSNGWDLLGQALQQQDESWRWLVGFPGAMFIGHSF